MSIKQDKVISSLPDNNFNIAKSMREAGYSKASTRAGSLYASLRKKIDEAYRPEEIKAKVIKAENKFIKDNDNSNYARMIELQCKIANLTKENQIQQNTINISDTLAKLKLPKDAVDVTTSNSKGYEDTDTKLT